MKALCWNGVGTDNLKCETVDDPRIQDPKDVILKVIMSSVCGSDLHFIHGIMPLMERGDIMGHEFIGEVVEVGAAVKKVAVGDRVVVPSIISCGECYYCQKGQWAFCDLSNPSSALQKPTVGYPTAAFYGCSHLYGGFAGSHAEYIRIPYGDIGCFKIPDGISNEQALFISDAAPTAYLGAENCNIRPGDTVAVWGCGAVGLLAQQVAFLLGAKRVIAIDQVEERLTRAANIGCETIDFSKSEVVERLRDLTGGHGPDSCLDAVGMEAQGKGIGGAYDKLKQTLHLATDIGDALRQAILTCRKGGTVSVLGVYYIMDKFPFGAILNKGLTVKAALQNGHQHIPLLLERAQNGTLDASYLLTHRFSLEDGSKAYHTFANKEDGCLRSVFVPNGISTS